MHIFLTTAAVGLAFSIGTIACNHTEPVEVVEGTWIRVENTGKRDFDEVVINFPTHTEKYGAIGAGSSSEYRRIPLAYGYASVQVRSGTDNYELQPFDYVGEEPLGDGRYTYELSIQEGYLELRFEPK